MKTREEIQDLINKMAKNNERIVSASKELKFYDAYRKSRWIAIAQLDYFLTQISPMMLAEYKRARQKGYV